MLILIYNPVLLNIIYLLTLMYFVLCTFIELKDCFIIIYMLNMIQYIMYLSLIIKQFIKCIVTDINNLIASIYLKDSKP